MGNEKFLDAVGVARVKDWIVSKFVSTTRKINLKPLSADITLTAQDVGTITQNDLDSAIQTAINDSWNSSY